MPVTGEAICSTAGAIAPAVNMLDEALRVARHETKGFAYQLKVPGQPVTSEARSMTRKWPNNVFANNLASDWAWTQFPVAVCSLWVVEHVTMGLGCPRII